MTIESKIHPLFLEGFKNEYLTTFMYDYVHSLHDVAAFSSTCKTIRATIDNDVRTAIIPRLKRKTSLSAVEFKTYSEGLGETSPSKMLSNCHKIESLDLTGIFKSDIELLEFFLNISETNKKTIKHVSLEKYSFTYLSVKQLFLSLPNLRKLDLIESSFSNFKDIQSTKRYYFPIQSLSLKNCCGLTDLDLEMLLKNCGTLTELDIFNCILITDLGLKALESSYEALRMLQLSGCNKITSKGLEETLKSGPNLTYLDLSRCSELEETGLCRLIRPFSNLRNLNLSGCTHVGSDFLKALVIFCPRLEELNLSGCPLVLSEGLEHLIFLKDLKILVLCGCRIETRELMVLEKYSLDMLDLSNCKHFAEKDLCYHIKKSPTLKIFKANNTSITDLTLRSLVAFCPDLSFLEIQECPGISDEGMALLSTRPDLLVSRDTKSVPDAPSSITREPTEKSQSYYRVCELM